MREILFRGQRTVTKEWILGALVIDWNGNLHIIEENTYGTDVATCDDCGCIEHDSFEVLPETVGQYTGLTDKNGTKIFEGDIIKDCYSKYFIEFNEYCAAFQIVDFDKDYSCGFLEDVNYKNCEVIGNIHDTPELLGGDAQ